MNIINEKGKTLIKTYEGLKLKAYKCSAGVPTIGYGATFYENGTKVKMADVITKERAEQLFDYHIKLFSDKVAKVVPELNSNQFSSLVSFAFNVGIGNFKSSTLLKKVKVNPQDESIGDEFLRWNKAGGKVVKGLTNRRNSEKELYFSEI